MTTITAIETVEHWQPITVRMIDGYLNTGSVSYQVDGETWHSEEIWQHPDTGQRAPLSDLGEKAMG